MLLECEVSVALVEECVFQKTLGRLEAGRRVAEGERHRLVDVALLAVLVDAWLGGVERLLYAGDGGEGLVVDDHRQRRFVSLLLAGRRHGDNRIADVADGVEGERVFVLRHRQNAVGLRQVAAAQKAKHAGHPPCGGEVDAADARVGDCAAHQLEVGHARQRDVVGELRLTGYLRARIDAGERLADQSRRDAGLPLDGSGGNVVLSIGRGRSIRGAAVPAVVHDVPASSAAVAPKNASAGGRHGSPRSMAAAHCTACTMRP